MSNRIRHVGIVVKNIEIFKDFLTDILELDIRSDKIEEGKFIEQLLNIEGTVVRTIKLFDERGVAIELLQFQDPESDRTSYNVPTNPDSFGITHVALTVSNIETIHNKIREMGYLPFSEPLLSENKEVKVFYMKGPEEILFELVEVL